MGRDIKEAFAALQRNFHEEPAALPASSCNMKTRVLAFRVFARAAGSMHFHLRTSHQLCPYLVFGLLDPASRRQVAAALECMPPCLHDGFTHEFMRRYPTRDELTSDQALHELHGIALLADVDISSIECRHAAIRKIVEARGVTWSVLFQLLSADFLCRQMSSHMSDLAECLGTLLQERAKHGFESLRVRKKLAVAGKKRPKRRGGGGGQRAFMRARLKSISRQEWLQSSRSHLFRQINEEYRNLSQEQRAEYEDLGEAATHSHRAGGQAFARNAPRQVQPPRNTAQHFHAAFDFLDGEHEHGTSASSANPPSDALIQPAASDIIRMTRNEQRAILAKEQAMEGKEQMQLVEYVKNDAVARGLGSMMPASLPQERYSSTADAYPSMVWYNATAEIAQA